MMLGINICSLMFTGLSLIQSGQGISSWYFLLRHQDAACHILLLSISSVSPTVIRQPGPWARVGVRV